MHSIPRDERVVTGTDFNSHVGEGNRGDEEVMGRFGFQDRNTDRQMMVHWMVQRMEMAVVNTFFQKRQEHKVTCQSGGRTQVDYICR